MEKERAPLIKEGVANPTDETTAQGRISARAAALIADLALLLCALLWGGSFTVVKVLLDLYPPNWLLFLRFSSPRRQWNWSGLSNRSAAAAPCCSSSSTGGSAECPVRRWREAS